MITVALYSDNRFFKNSLIYQACEGVCDTSIDAPPCRSLEHTTHAYCRNDRLLFEGHDCRLTLARTTPAGSAEYIPEMCVSLATFPLHTRSAQLHFLQMFLFVTWSTSFLAGSNLGLGHAGSPAFREHC
jgi:hypothetical protein